MEFMDSLDFVRMQRFTGFEGLRSNAAPGPGAKKAWPLESPRISLSATAC